MSSENLCLACFLEDSWQKEAKKIKAKCQIPELTDSAVHC